MTICLWDQQICSIIMRSWIYSISKDGWIPKEQARGEEMDAPEEFLAVTQDQGVPPSLILPLRYLLASRAGWVIDLYQGYAAWFKWYDSVL